MDVFIDLYSVLQVHPDAEQDMIQNAYKRLCKKYHPDVNPSPLAVNKIKQINTAYETLGNETSRRAYHREWVAKNGAKININTQSRVEVRERVVYVNREQPPKPRHGDGTQAAYQVVKDYFSYLSASKYKEAFSLVSDADKQRITYGEFVEWQESVTAVYEIGSFDLSLFKSHAPGKLKPELPYKAEEYAVKVVEKDKTTGRVKDYALNKYAILEGSSWKVYLGYQNLAPLMMQFKMMATTSEEAQIMSLWDQYKSEHDLYMGLLNRVGFNKKAELLEYVYKRYKRFFSLAVFQVYLPDRAKAGGKKDLIVKYVGYILSKNIRIVDVPAYLGDDRFGVLFAETDKQSSALAARRLLRVIRHDIAACFDFEIHVRAGVAEYGGQSIDGLITGCLRTINAASTDNAPGTENFGKNTASGSSAGTGERRGTGGRETASASSAGTDNTREAQARQRAAQ